MDQLICNQCGKKYEMTPTLWKCDCNGVLNLVKDTPKIDIEAWNHYPNSLWRYVETMPFSKDSKTWESVTMGEGQTPLIVLDPNEPNTYVKVDYMMPTLSFKDRGAAVLMTKAKELGVSKVIADSSGNAGTAIAAYAARCEIACDIYLSDETSPKKVAQIKAHGATIKEIRGTREDIAAAAQKAVGDENVFYASHVYQPYFFEGTKTYAYEIYEQIKGAPDAIIIPVGNGTLLLGAYYGFKELFENGLIHQIPKIIAIQAKNCAPLVKAYQNAKESASPVTNTGTLAEGIAIAAPARSKQILEAVQNTNGTFIDIEEEEILNARSKLSEKGFYVEVTSAVNFAGYMKYKKKSKETIVIPLCGAGIKSK
ncbi:threonine synthase [Bacillus safensis FO-36b]|uniref:threonine synthase n=2 Tax=Bacillus safensis TaxID=561879 RepID=UPI00045C8E61|nr:threonine synthase [Bacillus safensis]AWI36886.1 threonine synthase [Bacillus safensis FO-36b]KDE26310.1 threonine synthase [Bacillus safensis FO-36b]MCM3047004.1 threonine synthase [Bacillus safensis]MED5223817.1 threonine synthase [Bacillus safensis]